VRDSEDRIGIDRRTVAIHSDPSLVFPPIFTGESGESSPALADVDRDGVLELIQATGAGRIHVVDGATGASIDGFPVATEPIAVHPSPAWEPAGPVPIPHEAVVAAVAADDLDGDGRIEIVAASGEGRLYVFDDRGNPRPGFPVTSDPALSQPENRDRYNDADPGFLAGPTLADLDGDGDLELVAAAADGHVYAWRHDGSPVSGFPVRVADRSQVDIDPATGKATPRAGSVPLERLTKLIGSPAVGDLDADGSPEIVVTSNEEYRDATPFGTDSILVQALLTGQVDVGDEFTVEVAGRVYALHADGEDHAGGPFVDGWPVRIPLLISQLLPNVGTGTPGSPALADLDPSDGSDALHVAIFGTAGPALILDAAGQPTLGDDQFGNPNTLAVDFPNGGFFVAVPETVGSPDGPFFAALGSGAFGDLDGDGAPEYAAATAGVRQLIDVAASASQEFGDHQVTVWDPRTGGLFDPTGDGPVFPVVMDDLQFLSSPTLADVTGDGRPDVVQGSGAYLVRAYSADGQLAPGFPKFTHGWMIGSPIVGDLDGDGLSELAVWTREGGLFVWDTPGIADASAIAWQGFGRDRRNSGNLASDAPVTARPSTWRDGLLWDLGFVEEGLAGLQSAGSAELIAALASSGAADTLRDAQDALEADEILTAIARLLEFNQALLTPRTIRGETRDVRLRLREAGARAVARLLAD
ncbi:MAG: VCBS repeat-containing protein, partial [Myxococcota bacterium]|nr:VCBS repeat-containing protein [Myxococcota bacterium]